MKDDVAVAGNPGIVEGLVVLAAYIGSQIVFATVQVSHSIRLACVEQEYRTMEARFSA